MTLVQLAEIYVFLLAIFVGFEVISKVPVVLHTPLMSGTNAIHGIVVVGAVIALGTTHSTLGLVLGAVATAFGAMNLFGGFVVTDRMLEMFRARRPARRDGADRGPDGRA